MPDPARLTDEVERQVLAQMLNEFPTWAKAALHYQARLAAAENEVARLTKLLIEWEDDGRRAEAAEARLAAADNVANVLTAALKEDCGYSDEDIVALKEPTGNHAESSTTRGDIEEEDDLRAYAQEHGVPALLDHLGLDEFGNEVIATRRELRLLKESLAEGDTNE